MVPLSSPPSLALRPSMAALCVATSIGARLGLLGAQRPPQAEPIPSSSLTERTFHGHFLFCARFCLVRHSSRSLSPYSDDLRNEFGFSSGESFVFGSPPPSDITPPGYTLRVDLPAYPLPRRIGKKRAPTFGSRVVQALRHNQTASGAPVAEHRPQAGVAGSSPAPGSIHLHPAGTTTRVHRGKANRATAGRPGCDPLGLGISQFGQAAA